MVSRGLYVLFLLLLNMLDSPEWLKPFYIHENHILDLSYLLWYFPHKGLRCNVQYLPVFLFWCWHLHVILWCTRNSPRHWHTGLVSSRVSLTHIGRCLFSLGRPPFQWWCHNKNTLWVRCFITSSSLAPHLFLLGWLKRNLIFLLDHFRVT